MSHFQYVAGRGAIELRTLVHVRTVCIALMAACVFAWPGSSRAEKALHPIVAGVWYPADKDELKASIDKLTNEADVAQPPGHIVACIAPHAPYATFGAVDASAFKFLSDSDYDRVVVLGASHAGAFRGCSIPSVEAVLTPLGATLLDGPTIRQLDLSTLIDVRSIRYSENSERVQLHEKEYSIEVILPFLQVRLGAFKLIPMLAGEFNDYQGRMDADALASVADTLRKVVDDRTLVVVSSDLTHYGNNFSYRPFSENIIENIEALDKRAIAHILKRDFKGFLKYLDETGNNICGKEAIAILLALLPKDAVGTLLKYEVAARTSGNTESSISYASIVFTRPSKPKV